MVSNVISDHQVLNLSVLGELHEDLFIEVLKVVDCRDELTLGHIHAISFGDGGIRVLVEVLEDHAL